MTEEEKTILLTRHDGQLQRQEGRIRELERRQDDLEKLASSVAMLAQRQEDMDANIRSDGAEGRAQMGHDRRKGDRGHCGRAGRLCAFEIGIGLRRRKQICRIF